MAQITYSRFLDKVKEFEGFRPKPYHCPSGVLTIGYGHTHGVTSGMRIDEINAQKWLEYDLSVVAHQIMALLPHFDDPYIYSEGLQFALIDFVFNVGIWKFRKSTLYNKFLKGVEKPNLQSVEIELLKWTHSGSIVLKGLERRRAWEVSLLYE